MGRIPVFIISLLCVLTYSNADHRFFFLDETVFTGGFFDGLQTWQDIWLKNFFGNYRPIVVLYLKFIYEMFGNNYQYYHLLSLALFLAVCLLFYSIVLEITEDKDLSLLTVSLFAVHPIHHVFVTYKTMGCLMIYVILLQLAFLCCLKYLKGGATLLYGLSLAFFSLGLFAHEMQAFLPVYIAIYMHFIQRKNWKSIFKVCLSYAPILICYLFLRGSIQDVRPIDTLLHLKLSLCSYVSSLLPPIYIYVSKLFVPLEIVLVWNTPVITKHALEGVILFLILVLCLGYLIMIKWKTGLKAFSLAFFLAGFLPFGIAGFVYTHWSQSVFLETHWFTFSSIGFFLLAGRMFMALRKKWPVTYWGGLVVLVLVGLSLTTRWYNAVWQNERGYLAYWHKIDFY